MKNIVSCSQCNKCSNIPVKKNYYHKHIWCGNDKESYLILLIIYQKIFFAYFITTMTSIATLLAEGLTLVSNKYDQGRKKRLLVDITPYPNAQETQKKPKSKNCHLTKSGNQHPLQSKSSFQVTARNCNMILCIMLPSQVNQMEPSHGIDGNYRLIALFPPWKC